MTMTINEFIESEAASVTQDDSYYQMLATPLKPPSAFKKDHREQLKDFFKFAELRSQLEEAQKIIIELMAVFVSKEEFHKIKGELDNSDKSFLRFISAESDTPSERPVLFQEMFGFTDDTLLRIYDLGVDLAKKDRYEEGLALFAFLTTMAPQVMSYWIAQGLSLQALNHHEDAIAIFNAAKLLNSKDPILFARLIISYRAIKSSDLAKLELDELKSLVHTFDDDDKVKWELKIKEMG